MQISQDRLSHLKQLEAESMHIMKEVVAEFQNPAMLYSVGKDSSVMLHLLQKAFYPAPPPLPLVHVDTTWKFKEMIEFRDKDEPDEYFETGTARLARAGAGWSDPPPAR